MLVNREPGPSVIRSALAIASSVSCIGFTRAGFKLIRLMRERLLEIRVSPSTFVPSANVASSTTLVGCRREDSSAGCKDVRRMLHGFREVAGQFRQGGYEKIAKTMALSAPCRHRNDIETVATTSLRPRITPPGSFGCLLAATWRSHAEAVRNCHRHPSP